ncbi:MAG TPA: hypothetical protein VFR36_03610 [Sphingomicrobium sp.]|nr:hypothetical protein [Sphingomicrobium sp.]
MPNGITPELLSFIITMSQYMLIGFGIIIAGAALVYVAMFWKGNLSGGSIVKILQQTDVPKLATIIMIILAASLLGLLGVIEGEAVIALLSGIAGYVLGHRGTDQQSSNDKP